MGEMGPPVVMQYNGKTVKFCCPSCTKKFDADPEKFMKILADAEKKAAD